MRTEVAPARPRALQYPLLLECMGGLGDNIYARPFVRAWHDETSEPVWLRTPWPQLYADLPRARFVAPWRMALRTQQRNMHAVPTSTWDERPPARTDRRRFHYCLERPGESIVEEIMRGVGWPTRQRFRFDLPDFGASPVAGDAVAVIRPVTLRREWANAARNPDPTYIAAAAAQLRAAGFTVVVVADIDERTEPLLGALPDADVVFDRGELDLAQLLALVQHAAVVVGGPGWIVPAAVAFDTPAVFVGGGQGAHNSPAVLVDPRMGGKRARWLLPDDYCVCRDMRHDCPKHISDFDARFAAALEEVADGDR